MLKNSYCDLAFAAKALFLTEEKLLTLAAEGKITLSILLSNWPGINVCKSAHQSITLQGESEISLVKEIVALNIEHETAGLLLTNTKVIISPWFNSGHVQSQDGCLVAWNPVKSILSKKTSARYSSVVLPKGSGLLLTTQNKKPISLTISREDLTLTFQNLEAYKASSLILPPDEFRPHKNTTALLRDLNFAARKIYAIAIRDGRLYPARTTVEAVIADLPSFKAWGERAQAQAETPDYADLPDTARKIIQFKNAHKGGGRSKLPNSVTTYVSESLRALFKWHDEEAVKIVSRKNQLTVDALTLFLTSLEGKPITKALAERCSPLLLPFTPESGRPKLGNTPPQ